MAFEWDLLEGGDKAKLLEKGYRVLGRLGAGSKSVVLLFEYRAPGAAGASRRLACKLINTARTTSDDGDVFRECSVLAETDHPNLIQVHSILQIDRRYMIFMRHAELGDLCDFLALHGPVKEGPARTWIRQLATALDYLHTLGIVHRAVKPDNVLITAGHNLKLADFGHAKWQNRYQYAFDQPARYYCMTYCGTLGYAAPELLAGGLYEGGPVDMYALGVLMYALLNGSMPFDTSNLVRLRRAQVNGDYRFRNRVRTAVSDEAVETVARLMEPSPVDRADVRELLAGRWLWMEPNRARMTAGEVLALRKATGRYSAGQLTLAACRQHQQHQQRELEEYEEEGDVQTGEREDI